MGISLKKKKKILAFGQIGRRRRQLLIGPFAVLNDPRHFQPPTGVDFQVTVHKPSPRIVGDEPDRHPAAGRDADGVPLCRVGEVELGRVFVRVEVSDALTHHEEIEAVEVERVALRRDDARVLHYHFHDGVVRHHRHLRSAAHHQVIRRRACRAQQDIFLDQAQNFNIMLTL